jgi:hypothetical protein
MNKQLANQILTNLDETANLIDKLAKAGKVDPKVASELTGNIDSFADRFQVAAFGKGSLQTWKAKVGKVLQRDSDEPYMETFQNPQKPIQTDPDEPYMHRTEKSFNCDSIPTYDSDDTSQVTERKEYAVRDLSEHADPTKQQPSWSGGPAGKSTRQGSQQPEKKWAP